MFKSLMRALNYARIKIDTRSLVSSKDLVEPIRPAKFIFCLSAMKGYRHHERYMNDSLLTLFISYNNYKHTKSY